MRNFTLIIILIVLTLFSTEISAQHSGYHYGYSYTGSTVGERSYLPLKVKKLVRSYHQHHGYNWIRTTEFDRGHRRFFVLTFNKGRHYLELTVNRRGDIIKRHKYAIDYRKRRPNRRGYANRQVIYHHDGYVYSRREDRRRYDYPWDYD